MTLSMHRQNPRSRHWHKADAGRRLADLLRTQILDGTHRAGDPMPSEAELRVTHRAGRNVVRTAMELLRNEGYISRLPGRGTTVRSERVPCSLGGPAGISSVFAGGGNRVVTRFLSVDQGAVSDLVADRLGLAEQAECLIVGYETLVDRTPYSFATSYLPLSLAGDRFACDLAGEWTGDWFDVLEQLGFALGEMRLRVEAAAADDESASALAVEPGSPLVRFERLLHDGAGRPIDFGYSRCRSDRVLLQIDVG